MAEKTKPGEMRSRAVRFVVKAHDAHGRQKLQAHFLDEGLAKSVADHANGDWKVWVDREETLVSTMKVYEP